MPASTEISAMTTISSMSVNPASASDALRRPAGESQHRTYQSLYFVPSSAVPALLVNTSKTFCPPQVVASGSS